MPFRLNRLLYACIVALALLFASPAHAVHVDRGDIVVWGQYARAYGSPEYETHAYLIFVVAAGRAAGVYNGILSTPMETWDRPSLVYGHVDVITEAKDITEGSIFDVAVVLRPNQEMQMVVNIEEMCRAYESFLRYSEGYNQPFVFNLLRWMTALTAGWVSEWTLNLWSTLYGFNLDSFTVESAQGYVTNDIYDPQFFSRTRDCSSMALWSVLAGYAANYPAYRYWIMESPDLRVAVDCAAPGHIGWILSYMGWVDIEIVEW